MSSTLRPSLPRQRPRSAAGQRRRPAAVGALLAAGVLLSVGAPSALADGGASIASAPVVTLGQQQFGNTSTGGHDGSIARSWWTIQASAGDALTIDWEDTNGQTGLSLFPIGTTDFTFQNSSDKYDGLGSNYKSEFTYTIPTTGSYPLEFSLYATHAGPYDFTASVLHGIALGLPALTALPQTGTVAVGVHTPDGAPLASGITVTLQGSVHSYSNQQWQTLGTGTPVAGSATINYTAPDAFLGKSVDVRAIATGTGYSDAASPTQTIDGPPAPSPTPTPAPTPKPTPAPPVPTAVTRGITISRSGGRYRGRVSASASACYRSATVTLYRQGKPKVYGTAVTRNDGSWTISHTKLKGKAYAYVAPNTIGLSACSAAASRAIKR